MMKIIVMMVMLVAIMIVKMMIWKPQCRLMWRMFVFVHHAFDELEPGVRDNEEYDDQYSAEYIHI